MTARRHLNYWRALELLSAVDPRRSFSSDRDLLADLAEEMLLSRADQPVGKRARCGTDCLVRLVENGAVEKSVAEELWRAILAAGPGGEELTREDEPLAAGFR
jgi:hypothetical protein